MQRLERYGATEDEWFLFADMLRLGADLLPAVANPTATIAPQSALKSVGKTPSTYGQGRMVWGIGNWVQKFATAAEIDRWRKEPDYSICLIGRNVKALDFDITDDVLSAKVELFTAEFLSRAGKSLPKRYRESSPKFLLAFRCAEEYTKRVIKTTHGIIEFLGDRQQFLVAGTHTSGVRYAWTGLESDIPSLSVGEFESLWHALQKEFGVGPEIREKNRKQLTVDTDEPLLKRLTERDMVLSKGKEGSYNITCPFEHEHSTETVESATLYWPPHTGGYAHASIKCLHAHCAERSTEQFKIGLGFDLAEGFDALTEDEILEAAAGGAVTREGNPGRFKFVPAVLFASDGTEPRWLVKNMIPASSLGVIYGASGAGKTFVVFDIVACVARGLPWRGRKVQQGTIAYVCAEGAYFFRRRIQAYCKHNGVEDVDGLPVHVLDGAPNLMEKVVVQDLAAAIEAIGGPIAAVVIDTYANCMLGDENSGTDAGKVVANCKWLMRKLNTSVILVHHSGKDASRGARGWSGLRGAVDFEFCVTKEGTAHMLKNTKQKDGEDGIEFGFSLFPVQIGVDDDGDVVESCVIAESKIVPLSSVVKSGSDKVSERESHVFAQVQELFDNDGAWPAEAALIESVVTLFNYRPADVSKAVGSLIDKRLLDKDFDGRVHLA